MKKLQDGGLKLSGGTRLVDLVNMTDWEVKEHRGFWMGRVNKWGWITIMAASAAETLATDALLDFMSRLREGRLSGCTEPADLMAMCVSAARRQR